MVQVHRNEYVKFRLSQPQQLAVLRAFPSSLRDRDHINARVKPPLQFSVEMFV